MWSVDVAEIRGAVAYGLLRCVPIRQLVHTVCDVTRADHYSRVKVLVERREELAPADVSQFQELLRQHLSDGYRKRLASNLRPRTDRLLSNVGGVLPVSAARELCIDQVQHRLKSRRLAATKLLRRIDFGDFLKDALRAAVSMYGDTNALELLCRIPMGLRELDCCELINFVPENYLGDPDTYVMGLILARFWTDGELDHEHAAAEHPTAYLRALGRTRDVTLAEIAIRIVETSENPHTLLMAASAFGRCRFAIGVEAVDRRCEMLAADSNESRDRRTI